MQSVKDLDVYKITTEFVVDIYKITDTFPKSEQFGLVSQIRRSAISINSNLVEGAARINTGEYRHFVGIARGSAAELSFQIEISEKFGFINKDVANSLITTIERICKMLSGIITKLK